MSPASPIHQVTPDRLEIRSGGGCMSLFGLPFLAAGIFLLLLGLRVIEFSNAEQVPWWGYPVIALMGLVFAAVGGGLVFSRSLISLDKAAGRLAKEHKILAPVRREERDLRDFEGAILRYREGDSDTADSYDLWLQGRAGQSDFALMSGPAYAPALEQAGVVARFLGLPLTDATTDHATLVGREVATGTTSAAAASAPYGMISRVESSGGTLRISIPPAPWKARSLIGPAIGALAMVVVASLAQGFFAATGTPQFVQVCAGSFFALLALGALLGALSGYLRSRRGGTTVTASPNGITLEERGPWRSHTVSISAADIFGLDYSTPDSKLAAAELAAAQAGRGGATPRAVPARARRWVLAQPAAGVIIKARRGFVWFGRGLPGPEVEYLWASVRRALAGRATASPETPAPPH